MRVRALGWTGICLCLALAAGGCAGTRQTRDEAKPSGFLGDYSQLQPGQDGQAKLVWFDPNASWKAYNAVIVDPVTLWTAGEEGDLAKLSREDQQMLADRFHTALATALAKDMPVVTQPGPGVLRVRAAITEAGGSNVALDIVSTVIPQVRLLATVGGLAADTAATVGHVSGELEVLDSASGKRLLAGVDERVGTRGLEGVTQKWSDVQMAFDDWAERVRLRIAERRGTAPAPGA
jgi:hypothetical protein